MLDETSSICPVVSPVLSPLCNYQAIAPSETLIRRSILRVNFLLSESNDVGFVMIVRDVQ